MKPCANTVISSRARTQQGPHMILMSINASLWGHIKNLSQTSYSAHSNERACRIMDVYFHSVIKSCFPAVMVTEWESLLLCVFRNQPSL